MAKKLKKKSKRTGSKKRRRDLKDEIPFSKVRKPIPRPGSTMKDKSKYTRKEKYRKDWE